VLWNEHQLFPGDEAYDDLRSFPPLVFLHLHKAVTNCYSGYWRTVEPLNSYDALMGRPLPVIMEKRDTPIHIRARFKKLRLQPVQKTLWRVPLENGYRLRTLLPRCRRLLIERLGCQDVASEYEWPLTTTAREVPRHAFMCLCVALDTSDLSVSFDSVLRLNLWKCG